MTTARGMTPEELKEVLGLMAGWENGRQAMGAAEITKVLRYCREMERHAEAMAEGLKWAVGTLREMAGDSPSCAWVTDNWPSGTPPINTAERPLAEYRAFTTTEPTP